MASDLRDGERERGPYSVYGGEQVCGVRAFGAFVTPVEPPYTVPEPGGIITVAVDVGLGVARVIDFQPRGAF